MKLYLYYSLVSALVLAQATGASAAEVAEHPFAGVTSITRTETTPRPYTAHVVLIELGTPGLRFHLTGPAGQRETVRETTLEFLEREKGQIAINAHYFLPWPTQDREVNLVGLAASEGKVFSEFETPEQNYALVKNAPAINIDRENHAAVVHQGDVETEMARGRLWNAVAGSAQIVTKGRVTIPVYRDGAHPDGELTEGSPSHFSNADSWYERVNARSAIGVTGDGKTLILFVVDRAGGSQGLKVSEMARLLAEDYHAAEALNLDGGGSSSLAMEDPKTHVRKLVNASSDNPKGRSVGSNLAVFVPVSQ